MLKETAQNVAKHVLQKCLRIAFYTYIPVNLRHFLKKHHNRCTLLPTFGVRILCLSLSLGSSFLFLLPLLSASCCCFSCVPFRYQQVLGSGADPDPTGSFRIRAARIRNEFEEKKLLNQIHNFSTKCTI